MFSKACEYAIKAAVHIALASSQDRRVGLKEIAEATDSPEAFTAKLLQQLSRENLILSTKGPHGGFEMTADQLRNVCLGDVVRAIDGHEIYTRCGLGLKQCNAANPCPVHDEFKAIRDQLRQMLNTTTISRLAESLAVGEAVLKR